MRKSGVPSQRRACLDALSSTARPAAQLPQSTPDRSHRNPVQPRPHPRTTPPAANPRPTIFNTPVQTQATASATTSNKRPLRSTTVSPLLDGLMFPCGRGDCDVSYDTWTGVSNHQRACDGLRKAESQVQVAIELRMPARPLSTPAQGTDATDATDAIDATDARPLSQQGVQVSAEAVLAAERPRKRLRLFGHDVELP
eukprot:TRINITY_DN2344_c0_g1_i2.p1 TRINITY_DN2344_c0_g1~~TRINITY_DN2344_c0_g1_i2.p1  ORF type:complete len:198 (+),score=36.54 TRINITY_DN2344_c0_g1_i2:450-1043(+)